LINSEHDITFHFSLCFIIVSSSSFIQHRNYW